MMLPILAITFGPLEIAFAVIAGLSLIFIILFLFSKDPAKETVKTVSQPKTDSVEGKTAAVESPEEEKEAVPALLVDKDDDNNELSLPEPPSKPVAVKDDDEFKLPEVPELPEPKRPPVLKPGIPSLPDDKPIVDKSDEPEMEVEISPFVKKQGKDLPPKPGPGSIEDEADQQTIEEERES